MKNIMVFVPIYLPGFKGGGPIRTISNMVNQIGDEFNFHIITSDRDLGDNKPYADQKINEWQNKYQSTVLYTSNDINGLISIFRALKSQRYDTVHINSFFSFRFSILPIIFVRLLGIRAPIIIGPRGEFAKSALSTKNLKKSIFIFIAKHSGIYKNVTWHASSEYEKSDILNTIGSNCKIRIAIDLPTKVTIDKIPLRKSQNSLNVIFFSRISPVKNLIGAIKYLCQTKSKINFDIYGPIEDSVYFNDCMNESKNLPPNVILTYKGLLNPTDVIPSIVDYDLFILPTFGENYGHAIAEALSAGLPVLISNTTPWRNLEINNLGIDIPLDESNKFSEYIDYCNTIAKEKYQEWRIHILNWSKKNIGDQKSINENRLLFNSSK